MMVIDNPHRPNQGTWVTLDGLLARVDSMAMGMEDMLHGVEDVQRDQHVFMRNQEMFIRDMSTHFDFPLMATCSTTHHCLIFPTTHTKGT